MPPKRAPKAPPAPARSLAKKAPRPAATKKKQAPPKPTTRKDSEPIQPKGLEPRRAPKEVTQQLATLLFDPPSARSVVDFIVGKICGLESRHVYGAFTNMTPFLLAVYLNRLDVVQLLVAEHSANTKAMAKDNYTALHLASERGHLEMVRWLVERCGLDVRAVDANGQSPLHLAIHHKHSDAALFLLELGADPNLSNNRGQTPLYHACSRGLADVVRVLINKGINIEAASIGQSALHVAISSDHGDVALLLLELGADPNSSDAFKFTPLHFACYYGLVDVARSLIAKGASRDAVNAQGRTPLDIAVVYQQSAVAALFEARL